MPESNWPLISQEEIELASDTAIIDQKRIVQEKMQTLLGLCRSPLQKMIAPKGFEWSSKSGKISKGENHKGYPFAVYDFPIIHQKEQLFLYRTMWWWGHHFICSLLISGNILEHYTERFLQSVPNLLNENVYIHNGENPWDNEIAPSAFVSVTQADKLELERIIENRKFFRIACFLPLTHWKDLPDFSKNTYFRFMKLLVDK